MPNSQKPTEAPKATAVPALLCDMSGLRFRTLYSLFTAALPPTQRESRSVRIEQDGATTHIAMHGPDISITATSHPDYTITSAVEYGEDKTAFYQQKMIDKLMEADPAYRGLGQLRADYVDGTKECDAFVRVTDSILQSRGVDAAWATVRDVLRAAMAARMNEVRDYKIDLADPEVQALAGIMHFTSGVSGVTLVRTDAPGVWQAFNTAISAIASHIPNEQV